jgi:large subunit ribosomal protein L17
MLANLAASLFEHGKITTTEARARRLRPYAEKLITFAKRGDLHARRQVQTVIPASRRSAVTGEGIVYTLFTEIAPSFADRPGGYTRITKLGPRKGDAAPMAVIELVREEVTAARPRRRTRRQAPQGAPAPAAVDESATAEAETAEAEETGAADAAVPEAEAEEPAEASTAEAAAPETETGEADDTEATGKPEASA